MKVNILNSFFVYAFLISVFSVFDVSAKPLNVAVFQLSGNGYTNGELLALTERLRIHLSENAEFNVLERDRMEDILKEQGFQQNGCTETECAVKIGQLLNVEFIIIGVATNIENLKTLLLRMVNVSTGKVERTAVLDCEQCSIEKLLKEKVKEIALDIANKKPIHSLDQSTDDFLSVGKQFIKAIDSHDYEIAYQLQLPDDKNALSKARFIELAEKQRSSQGYLPAKDTTKHLALDVPSQEDLKNIKYTLQTCHYNYRTITSIRILTELGWRPGYLKSSTLQDSGLTNDEMLSKLSSSMVFTATRRLVLMQIDSTISVYSGALAEHVQDSAMRIYNDYLRQKISIIPIKLWGLFNEKDTIHPGQFAFQISNRSKDTLFLSECSWNLRLFDVGKSTITISFYNGEILKPGQKIQDTVGFISPPPNISRVTIIRRWTNEYGNTWVEYSLQNPIISYDLESDLFKTSSPLYKLTGIKFLVPWGFNRSYLK